MKKDTPKFKFLKKEKCASIKDKSLTKMNDVERREFIKGVMFTLGALSVPSIVRLETAEKLSKKIFGSATAYAQQAGITCFNSFNLRAGHPTRALNFGAAPNNFRPGAAPLANVAVPWTQADSRIVAPEPGGLQDWVVGPQAEPFFTAANSPLKTSLLDIAVTNAQGAHSPRHQSLGYGMAGSANQVGVPSAFASTFGQEAVVKNPILIGGNGQIEWSGDAAPAELRTTEFSTPESFFRAFEALNLNREITEAKRNAILKVVLDRYNEVSSALKTSQANKELLTVSAGNASEFLQTQLRQALETEITRLEGIFNPGNLNEPNGMATNVALPRALAISVASANLGVAHVMGFAGSAGDWHGRDPNAFADMIPYTLEILTNYLNFMQGDAEYQNMRSITAWISEFGRTPAVNGGDWGDRGVGDVGIVDSKNNGAFIPGIYSNMGGNGNSMGWDNGNNTYQAQMGANGSEAASLLRIMGINPADFGYTDPVYSFISGGPAPA